VCIHDDARQDREHLEAKRVLGKVELELDALAAPARDANAHDVVLGARERAVFAVSAVLDEEGLGCLTVVLPSTVLTVVAVLAVLAGLNVFTLMTVLVVCTDFNVLEVFSLLSGLKVSDDLIGPAAGVLALQP
jgi:hypothetical protein